MFFRSSDSDYKLNDRDKQAALRAKIQADTEAFLRAGGSITQIESHSGHDQIVSAYEKDWRRGRDRNSIKRLNRRALLRFRRKLEADPDLLISPEEVGEISGVSIVSIRRWKKHKERYSSVLPKYAFEDPLLWRLSDVVTWADELIKRVKEYDRENKRG